MLLTVTSLNTVTKEELKVASDNSKKLADELTQILNRIKADLGHRENSEIVNDATEEQSDDNDTVKLLQIQINQLEQEINKLEKQNPTIDPKEKSAKLKSSKRKKYRQMLEDFYHGKHFNSILSPNILSIENWINMFSILIVRCVLMWEHNNIQVIMLVSQQMSLQSHGTDTHYFTHSLTLEINFIG